MRLVRAWAVVLALHCACTSPSADRGEPLAPRIPDPIARFAGHWIDREPRTVLHEGQDTIWSIVRADAGWTIGVTLVLHPKVTVPRGAVTRQEFEPVALTWIEDALAFTDPREPRFVRSITVDVRDDRLRMPAIVQRDERTFEFRAWHERGRIELAHDPRFVPAGPAVHTFGSWPDQPCSYRLTDAESIAVTGARVPAIELLQRTPAGIDHVCCTLVLVDGPYAPYLRRGESSPQFYGPGHERLSDADWTAIQALPLSTGVPPR